MKIRKKNRANYIYFDLPFQLDQYGRKTTERVDCLVYSFAIVDLMSKEVTVHRNVMGKCVVAKGYDSVIFYITKSDQPGVLSVMEEINHSTHLCFWNMKVPYHDFGEIRKHTDAVFYGMFQQKA